MALKESKKKRDLIRAKHAKERKKDDGNAVHTYHRVCLTCSVRLLLSSVWIHALRVSSVMKI